MAMSGRDSHDPVLAAVALLGGAREARSQPEMAEGAVLAALELAPSDLGVRLAAYRFYFYNHRLAAALPHAEHILAHAARRLNIASDWRAVGPEDAPFSEWEEAPGLYLQTLLAYGYCLVRTGDVAAGERAIAKVRELDRSDRLGAGRLLAVIAEARAGAEADD